MVNAISGPMAFVMQMLNIDPDHFGSSPKSKTPGSGTLRRHKREAEHRKREAERVKDAAPAVMTRQQRRFAERQDAKRIRSQQKRAAMQARRA